MCQQSITQFFINSAGKYRTCHLFFNQRVKRNSCGVLNIGYLFLGNLYSCCEYQGRKRGRHYSSEKAYEIYGTSRDFLRILRFLPLLAKVPLSSHRAQGKKELQVFRLASDQDSLRSFTSNDSVIKCNASWSNSVRFYLFVITYSTFAKVLLLLLLR